MMNVQLPQTLKQLGHQTTQLAVSTSLIAVAQAGCLREDDLPEVESDAGEDAIVENLRYGVPEAAAHVYHQPPASNAVVVMSADLEDAPLTRPPEPSPRVIRLTAPAIRVPVARTSAAADAGPADAGPTADAGDAGDDAGTADAVPVRTAPAPLTKPASAHDPVADSYLRSYSAPSTVYGGRL
jgi:hypothetical protein